MIQMTENNWTHYIYYFQLHLPHFISKFLNKLYYMRRFRHWSKGSTVTCNGVPVFHQYDGRFIEGWVAIHLIESSEETKDSTPQTFTLYTEVWFFCVLVKKNCQNSRSTENYGTLNSTDSPTLRSATFEDENT